MGEVPLGYHIMQSDVTSGNSRGDFRDGEELIFSRRKLSVLSSFKGSFESFSDLLSGDL